MEERLYLPPRESFFHPAPSISECGKNPYGKLFYYVKI